MPNQSFSLQVSELIKPFNKIIKVDSDKSISIRSFLIGAISHNISEVKNVLESDDVFSCIRVCQKLGVKIDKVKAGHYLVYGKGLGSLYAKKNTVLDCGNSGTTARLLIGLLSTNPDIQVKIKGDHSLNKRNMSKLIDLLGEFGATFLPPNKNNFPLTLISSAIPIGIKYRAGVSAQLKSAAMLAGLNANGVTNIIEEEKSRNSTENMLLQSPHVLKIKKNKKGQNHIKVFGKEYLNPLKINVSGDPSSAAFFTALTILTAGAKLTIHHVGLNPRRIGFYNILKKHGAKIKFLKKKIVNNDVETFLFQVCNFSPSGKILNSILLQEYQRWKKSVNKECYDRDIKDIKEYLNSCEYALKSTVWTDHGSNEGYYGLSLKNDEYKHKTTSSTGKKVEKIENNTGQILGTWETIAKAAEAEHISAPKMSRSIKNAIVFNNDYYYKLIKT